MGGLNSLGLAKAHWVGLTSKWAESMCWFSLAAVGAEKLHSWHRMALGEQKREVGPRTTFWNELWQINSLLVHGTLIREVGGESEKEQFT